MRLAGVKTRRASIVMVFSAAGQASRERTLRPISVQYQPPSPYLCPLGCCDRPSPLPRFQACTRDLSTSVGRVGGGPRQLLMSSRGPEMSHERCDSGIRMTFKSGFGYSLLLPPNQKSIINNKITRPVHLFASPIQRVFKQCGVPFKDASRGRVCSQQPPLGGTVPVW